MAKCKEKTELDIEQGYSAKQFVAKLRRLANCIEQNKTFRIQMPDEKITVPPDAIINIEHEREADMEGAELQITQAVAQG